MPVSKSKKSTTVKIKHPFFRGLSEKMKEQLVKMGKTKSFKKDKAIFSDGGKAEVFFLILSGKVNLLSLEQDVRFEAESEKRVFYTLNAGDVMGWSWATAPYRWSVDAVAVKDCDVFAIDGLKLRAAMQKDHELGYEIYKRLLPIVNKRLGASRLKLQMFGAKPFATAEGG